jgi:hypothetical protein
LANNPVQSLSFINFRISNAGKVEIGSQDKQWTFQITGPREAILSIIGEPLPSSKRLVVKVEQRSGMDRIAVQVGLFEPREFFDIRFIVANASDASRYPSSLKVSTTLVGLPEPLLTNVPPEERAFSILLPWLFGVLYVGFIALVTIDNYFPNSVPPVLSTGDLPIWGKALGGFVFAAVCAVILTKAIGWIAVKLWQLGIVH